MYSPLALYLVCFKCQLVEIEATDFRLIIPGDLRALSLLLNVPLTFGDFAASSLFSAYLDH